MDKVSVTLVVVHHYVLDLVDMFVDESVMQETMAVVKPSVVLQLILTLKSRNCSRRILGKGSKKKSREKYGLLLVNCPTR